MTCGVFELPPLLALGVLGWCCAGLECWENVGTIHRCRTSTTEASMHSTLRRPKHPYLYLGADLTDRYARRPKPIDVCGLMPAPDGSLLADFWTWEWPSGDGLDIGEVIAELGPDTLAMLDGPQGLARPPERMRTCERLVGAAGKTPSLRPPLSSKPFTGFVLSGLDLFTALSRAGVPIYSSEQTDGHVGEVYPGDLWPLLGAPGLPRGMAMPKKTSREGWEIRKHLLEAVGVRFGGSLIDRNHDQLDAAIGAVVSAAAKSAIPGLRVTPVGVPVWSDEDVLREGEMQRFQVVSDELKDRVRDALGKYSSDLIPVGVRRLSAAMATDPSAAYPDTNSENAKGPAETDVSERLRQARTFAAAAESAGQTDAAANLLAWLIIEAGADRNDPILLGYGAAWKLLLPNREYPQNKGPNAWGEIIALAEATTPQLLHGLGPVRLDTFLVAETRIPPTPGDGHWKQVDYEPDEWLRVFGDACLIRARDVT